MSAAIQEIFDYYGANAGQPTFRYLRWNEPENSFAAASFPFRQLLTEN